MDILEKILVIRLYHDENNFWRFKGKKLLLPKDKNTRPLKDLVKESIFNLLEHSKNKCKFKRIYNFRFIFWLWIFWNRMFIKRSGVCIFLKIILSN